MCLCVRPTCVHCIHMKFCTQRPGEARRPSRAEILSSCKTPNMSSENRTLVLCGSSKCSSYGPIYLTSPEMCLLQFCIWFKFYIQHYHLSFSVIFSFWLVNSFWLSIFTKCHKTFWMRNTYCCLHVSQVSNDSITDEQGQKRRLMADGNAHLVCTSNLWTE